MKGRRHLIGTQGVGKSTLLRALLFFYNADKLKLGIPKEKKSFEAFYFSYANSYIVYEVMRENGAYCVVVSKAQGRAFFRFVDAPFSRDWFMNEENEVLPEWHRIRERIGSKIYVSGKVEGYGTYRDIIFGNNRGMDSKFRKFAIVENAKYQNIPRTIQNVFLNSKLDADFIKDTIIRSMSDEDSYIDLQYYRGQTKEFEQEYRDVMRWFEKNKHGEIPVRNQAERVTEQYRTLLHTRKQIDELRAELNFAEKRARQDIPVIGEEIRKKEEEVARLFRLIGEQQQKHDKEREGLVAEIGVLADKLKQAAGKREEYEKAGIEEIRKRVAREDQVTNEAARTREMKAELTRAQEDILAKYRRLQEQEETNFHAFANDLQSKILDKQSRLNKQQEELMTTLRESEEQAREGFAEKFRTADAGIAQLENNQATCRQALIHLQYEHPYGQEMKDCEEGIRRLQDTGRTLEANIRQCRQECDRLRQEGEVRKKEIRLDYQEKAAPIRKEQATAKEQVASLDGLIDKWKGSFCEWLEKQKPDWAETVGKVADVERVLYNDSLNPRLTAAPDTAFFGITIDTTAIDRSVRTPEEMRNERQHWLSVAEELFRRLTHLADEEAAIIAAEEKKYGKRIREITTEQRLLEAELQSLPAQLKQQQADLATWKTKEEEQKARQSAEINARMNENAHRLVQAREERDQLQTVLNKQLKACEKTYKEAKAVLQAELNQFKSGLETEIATRKREQEKRRQELNQAQEAELDGKGVDTAAIRKYDAGLEKLARELDYIKTHRPLVFEYEKDKRELLDKEPEFRQQKKVLEGKRDNLDMKFAQHKEKLTLRKKEAEDERDKSRKELDNLDQGLQEVERFRKDEVFCPPSLVDRGEKATRQSCSFLVNNLKSRIVDTIQRKEEFKKAVNLFKSNFSSRNTFNFRTELLSEQDYEEFASGLCEFVDNNKIADYQKRISERYTDIIRRISKEVGDLTRNESEIHQTIGAINTDFVERNFAGVIREIALRALQSSDRLMQLLLEIKRFSDENQHNMGEVDLFSQVSREEVNATAVRYLLAFMKLLQDEPSRKSLALSDTFNLEFRVKENDNDTGWVEKIANVGSDGTDILVKAMVNIMLINVFKEKASRKFGDFKLHCMMDEIGKLHPNNVKGILDFANLRNILLVNSSPTTYNVADYRYTYLLSKDSHSNTLIVPLLTRKEEQG